MYEEKEAGGVVEVSRMCLLLMCLMSMENCRHLRHFCCGCAGQVGLPLPRVALRTH